MLNVYSHVKLAASETVRDRADHPEIGHRSLPTTSQQSNTKFKKLHTPIQSQNITTHHHMWTSNCLAPPLPATQTYPHSIKTQCTAYGAPHTTRHTTTPATPQPNQANLKPRMLQDGQASLGLTAPRSVRWDRARRSLRCGLSGFNPQTSIGIMPKYTMSEQRGLTH